MNFIYTSIYTKGKLEVFRNETLVYTYSENITPRFIFSVLKDFEEYHPFPGQLFLISYLRPVVIYNDYPTLKLNNYKRMVIGKFNQDAPPILTVKAKPTDDFLQYLADMAKDDYQVGK